MSNQKQLICIFIAIMILVLSCNIKNVNKSNKQIFTSPIIKMIILLAIAYFAYNKYIEIAIALFVLYIMLEHQSLNNEFDEAMFNIHSMKTVERFTNMIN